MPDKKAVLIMKNISEVMPGLYLIDLPLPELGFEKFISSWFFKDGEGKNIVVDVGPAATVPALTSALRELTDSVDHVLLTHIHLDHSGGIGQFLRDWSGAKAIVSPRGLKHLISPEMLWNASINALGDIARAYGEPLPASAERFIAMDDPRAFPRGVEAFATPGHASHHVSYRVTLNGKKAFFVGEAAGLTLPYFNDGGAPYLRPSTPRKFDATAAMNSIEKLKKQMENDDTTLCYAHWGFAQNAKYAVELAAEQLRAWTRTIRSWTERGIETEKMADQILTMDPLLASFGKLPENLQKREMIFINNSIKGFVDWARSTIQ